MDVWQDILEQVRDGGMPIEIALKKLAETGTGRLGFATLDMQRAHRRGLAEVVYAPGKSADQLEKIITTLFNAGQNVLVSRISEEQAQHVLPAIPQATYHRDARALTLYPSAPPDPVGLVSVVAAGTSDMMVASEAAVTARHMGANVKCISDIGVAGLHRIFPHLDDMRASSAVIVVAGMEGALPSVVAGLIDKPLIAVPTSVGYGTGFGGVAALLGMLNSCVPGITVVNIDNGFGAGVAAAMINRQTVKGSAT